MKALVYSHHFQMNFAISNVFLGNEVLYEVLWLWVIPAVCNGWISDFSRKTIYYGLFLFLIEKNISNILFTNIDD